jgi:RNA polymerase sigma-70 factor (ECF subfamily)
MLLCKKGDLEAFNLLVSRNLNKVHALVFRFLGDAGQVEDLTQEVFLRIFRTAARYEPTAKFSTWLYRIVANLSFNVLRSRRRGSLRQVEVRDGEEDTSFYSGLPDGRYEAPHEELDNKELRLKVAEAIDGLPESQKVAIILNKYENKSYEDIAEVLDCSTMAVKSLLSRARGNLRRHLWRYLRQD